MAFYNEKVFSEVRKALDERTGYNYQEFNIYEAEFDPIKKKFNINFGNVSYTNAVLVIESKIFSDYYFLVLEEVNTQKVAYIFSPGEIKNLESRSFDRLLFNNLRNAIAEWMKFLDVVVNELSIQEKIEKEIDEFIKKVQDDDTDNEMLTKEDIDKLKETISNLESELQTQFDELLKKNADNDEKIRELTQELEATKNELQSIYANAKKLDKKSWKMKTALTLSKMIRMFPNTAMYLTTTNLLVDLPLETKALGLGVVIVSDISKSDVSATDIIDKQLPPAK